MAGILEGITVLDFGQAIAAPTTGCLLAHLGADVIKVEPLEGEFSRVSPSGDDSTTFLGANMNKRSLAINLKDPRGKAIVLSLAGRSDVVLHNFRVGVMEKMGLDYASISRTNPRVVYCAIYMYGETGPLSHKRGGDPWAQAMTGAVESVGSPTEPPQMSGHVFMDMGAAIMAACGILAGLLQRERTNRGLEVNTNLLNVGAFLQYYAILDYLIDGVLRRKSGRGYKGQFPYGAYPAKDGDVFTLFGQDDGEWTTVCSLLGIEHLLSDPRYDMHAKRVERKFELYPILDEAFRKRTCVEWERLFHERGLRCERCLDYSEFVAHPQFLANDMIALVDHPRYGSLKMLANPLKFRGAPSTQPKAPPVLGQHTSEILTGLGFSGDEIEGLSSDGVVALPSQDMLKPAPRRAIPLGHMRRRLSEGGGSKAAIRD